MYNCLHSGAVLRNKYVYIYISMYNRIGVKKKKSNEYKNDRKLNDRASDTIGGSSVFITLTV